MIAAFLLRLWGVGFGLPGAEARPDEMTIAWQAMKFGTGDPNPHSFNYPSLYKYVSFGLFGGWYAVGRLVGVYGDQTAFLRDFFDGAVEFRLLMRLWSVGAGTAGVALLLRGPGGIWSAALLAGGFLHVRDSHFGVTDITMVTLCTAAVLFAERAATTPTWRPLLAAAVFAGLATSTKYNAGVLALPLALAAGSPPRIAAAAFVMVAAFLFGTPYALLDSATFRHDAAFEFSHLETGQFVDVGNGWVQHLHTLWRTCGPPYLLLTLAGLFYAPRRGWRRAGILYSFPLVYFLLIGRGETAFFRYVLPVLPFLAMAGGELLSRVPRLGVRAVLLTGVMLPTVVPALRADQLMAAGDTRDAMGRWIETNVPTDSVIVHAGAYTGAPMLQRNVANLAREYRARQGRADSAGFRKPEDPTWYNTARPMYDVRFVEKAGIDFASQDSVAAILADPPPWLLVEDYFLVHYSAVPAAILDLVHSERYERVHTESATNGPVDAPWFDQQDAFYLPAANFTGFVRMGPTLHLYRRRG